MELACFEINNEPHLHEIVYKFFLTLIRMKLMFEIQLKYIFSFFFVLHIPLKI